MPTYNAQTVRDLIAANTSADDALIAAMYPLAVRTPRATVVTYTTLASAGVWGRTRAAAVIATLREAASSPGIYGPLAADAQQAVDLLTGPGFDPTDPESVAAIAAFVEAGVITAEESAHVRYAYPDPATCPTAQDVADERAADAAQAGLLAYYQANVAVYNAWDAAYVAYATAVNAGQNPTPPKGLVREA